jgi:hypothetical protein
MFYLFLPTLSGDHSFSNVFEYPIFGLFSKEYPNRAKREGETKYMKAQGRRYPLRHKPQPGSVENSTRLFPFLGRPEASPKKGETIIANGNNGNQFRDDEIIRLLQACPPRVGLSALQRQVNIDRACKSVLLDSPRRRTEEEKWTFPARSRRKRPAVLTIKINC